MRASKKFLIFLGLAIALSIVPTLFLSNYSKANVDEPFSSSEMIAINIPNFQPSANFQNGTLTVNIPANLLQAPLSETLRANEGRIKSTEFQRLDLKNMRATLRGDGIRVNGDWHFEARERTIRNPITGRWSHTPWVGFDGNFHQDFNIRLNDGRLIAETNGRPYVSSSKWYGVIVDEIVHHLQVRNNVKQQLDAQLAEFNGFNVQGLMVKYGANEAARQLGVNQREVSNFINSNVGAMNASFRSSGLTIAISLPNLAPELERFDKPGNNGSVSCSTFCSAERADGRPVWGSRVGINVGSETPSGASGVCSCAASPAFFVKKGNNGTVSCDTFCRGSQWGEVGTCVGCFDNRNGSGRGCDYLPGFLEGAELTCSCVR